MAVLDTTGTHVVELLSRAQHLHHGQRCIGKSSASLQSSDFGENKLELNAANPLTQFFHSQLHSYAGDFVFSVFFSTILYLTLEEPILLIENYITSG